MILVGAVFTFGLSGLSVDTVPLFTSQIREILLYALYGLQNQLFSWSNWINLSRRMAHIKKKKPTKKA